MAQDFNAILSALAEQGCLRHIPTCSDAEMTDFTGNDYLGLAAEPCWVEEFLSQARDVQFCSSASRLLCTRGQEYFDLEADLDTAYGKSSLLFNSGYHANTGCVSALGAMPETLILADKLVHASIIDGIILSKAPFRRFRHNDVNGLRRLLEKYSGDYRMTLVVVESIYSMDGDVAPLREIVALKRDFPGMFLYVDEAHGLGVRGAHGLGLCEELGILSDVDLLIGTFGKALASCGAFAATNPDVREYLVNSARSFIFSTAIPPVNVAFTRFIFSKMLSMSDRREHLAEISRQFRAGVEEITGEKNLSTSQIVPLLAGSNQKALDWSAALRKEGVLVLPIRKPTVPEGTERLRFSLNAGLTDTQIERTLDSLRKLIR